MTVRGIKCLGWPMCARAGPWLPDRPLADVPVALAVASGQWQEIGLYFGAPFESPVTEEILTDIPLVGFGFFVRLVISYFMHVSGIV